MKSTTVHQYITLEVAGSDVEDYRKTREIEAAIVNAFGERAAYQVFRLSTVERIEEELLEPEPILAASGGKLPVILVNITLFSEDVDAHKFAALESKFALRLVAKDVFDEP